MRQSALLAERFYRSIRDHRSNECRRHVDSGYAVRLALSPFQYRQCFGCFAQGGVAWIFAECANVRSFEKPTESTAQGTVPCAARFFVFRLFERRLQIIRAISNVGAASQLSVTTRIHGKDDDHEFGTSFAKLSLQSSYGWVEQDFCPEDSYARTNNESSR